VYIDFDNTTVNILSMTDISFHIDNIDTIVVNKDDIYNNNIFMFDRSFLPKLHSNYLMYKNISPTNINIKYSNKLYTNDTNETHNLYNNDIVMI
jgi:hypothetical protein